MGLQWDALGVTVGQQRTVGSTKMQYVVLDTTTAWQLGKTLAGQYEILGEDSGRWWETSQDAPGGRRGYRRAAGRAGR